jgi:hypothetical protein
MANYVVRWEIAIEAGSPEEAAGIAQTLVIFDKDTRYVDVAPADDADDPNTEWQSVDLHSLPASEPEVIHTVCRYCDLDIENLKPFPAGEWRDRGNNWRCNDGQHDHAPID